MPISRRLGNRVLSAAQNAITGAGLSEWHSGFRAYRVKTLATIDVATLPAGFDFDTAITRAIHVDIRYMLWVMKEVDHADNLLKEMTIKYPKK